MFFLENDRVKDNDVEKRSLILILKIGFWGIL